MLHRNYLLSNPLPLVASILFLSACSPVSDNNASPRAVDDRLQVNNGASIEIPTSELLKNDSDPDGDPLTLTAVSTPRHGTLTSLSNGGYRYTNDGRNNPSDRFEYRIEDGNGGKATGTVIIDIAQGPTANDDSQETDEDTAIIIDVLANDTSSEDSSITISAADNDISISTPPDHGITKVVSGKVEYTPNSNFYGNDSFSYIISVNGIPSNPATVTIAVRPVNDPPQANEDNISTQEDTPVIIDPLINDTDIDDGIDPDTLVITSQPSHGNVTSSNGRVTYTPDTDFFGSDGFTYQVRDHSGALSNEASVTLTITPVNDPPVASDDSVTTGKNRPVTIDVLANDNDSEGLQGVSVQLVNQPPSGSVTINNDKSIDYTPMTGFSGTDHFTYRLKDQGENWSNTATVTVQVVNTPPTAAGSCSTTRQGNNLSGTLGGNDPDPEENLIFRLGINGAFGNGPMTTANGGTVRINNPATGAYLYTPKQGTGGRGRDSFHYQVVDGSGATANGTETIIVDLRIMPLGDSITAGVEDYDTNTGTSYPAPQNRKSYRKPLYDRLVNAGYGFDFVGSRNDGSNVSPSFDSDAEGWPGARSDELAGTRPSPIPTVEEALDTNPADIVLLHIGTNDMNQTGVDDIEDILNAIDDWEQQNNLSVTVILARIIDQWHWKNDGHPGGTNPQVSTLNNAISNMVQARTDDVILVDMQSALQYPNDLNDRSRTSWHYWLHPYPSGYEKMADVWFNALTSNNLLDKCP